jgi:hypothetical protein
LSTVVIAKVLVALLIGWCAVYAIYFAFIRSVILTHFRFTLSEVADDLNVLLLSGRLQPDDAAFSIVKSRLNRVRGSLEGINLTNLLLAVSYGHTRPLSEVEIENKTIQSSTEELRGVSLKMDMAVGGTFAANSPFLVGIVFLLITGASVYFWFAARVKHNLTVRVWGAINSPEACAATRRMAYA